jgi:hypothetical protein
VQNCFLMKLKLKKGLPLVIIVLCCQFCANSQKNFKDGYVVLKNGDTLRGEIDYRNWEVNPLKIQFQRSGTVTNYTPSDLRSFEITDADVYVSKIVTKDMRPVYISAISAGFNIEVSDSIVIDTVFLRRLVNGAHFWLYQLIDRKEHYYIQQAANDKIEELVYRSNIDERTGNLAVQNQYKNQLAAFSAGNNFTDVVLGKISKSHYAETDLVQIVRLLNGEDLTATENSKSGKRNLVFVTAGAGITYFNFSFNGDLDKWNKLNFPGSIAPVATIAADFSGNRNLQQLAVRFGLSYSHLVYNGGVVANDLLSHSTAYNYKLVQNSFTPEIAVFYHFLKQKNLRIHGGLGLGFVFSSYPVNEYRTKRLDTGDEQVEYNLLNPENRWLTPNLMAGARFWNKLNINLTTKLAGGFINYSRVRGALFPLTFSASYIFFSKK